jgi:hypothetical protein
MPTNCSYFSRGCRFRGGARQRTKESADEVHPVERRYGRFAECYRDALTLVTNPAERRFLEARLTELSVTAAALEDSGPKT